MRWLLWVALFSWVCGAASAATFQVENEDCVWRIVQSGPFFTTCPEPMEKYTSPDGVMGYERQLEDDLMRIGGWALTPSDLQRRVIVDLDVVGRIDPEPGEQNGDPVNVYFCSKIYVSDDGVDTFYDGVLHRMRVLQANSTQWQLEIEPNTPDGDDGWFRDEVIEPDFQTEIGHRIRLQTMLDVSGVGWATADSRLQVTFSPDGCEDPPIAVQPVPSASWPWIGLAPLAMAALGSVALKRRRACGSSGTSS